MRVTASAPGKVVIIGEYAVLEGAPALVMAVDRRASASLCSHNEPFCSVSARGLERGSGRFRLGSSGPRWLAGDDTAFRLATHAIGAFFAAADNPMACRPFHLILDSTALMERGAGRARKLGLGSSAALTVALCYALSYYVASQHEHVDPPGLERLIDIHTGLQGRRGSGLDVAASLHGGLVEFSRSPAPRAVPGNLPSEVAYRFVWSGHEAATGRFLARLEQWRGGHDRAYRQLTGLLAAVAREGVRAAHDNDAQEFLIGLDEYVAALEALGRASGADILSAPHRRLRALARRYGVVYKPCGAGGGDIGVGMSRDPEALKRFQDDVAAEKFQPLSLNCEREGVQTRSGN